MSKHLLVIAATLSAGGCAATTTHEDLAAFLKAHEHAVSGTETRVAAADSIRIVAPRIHEINGEVQTVQSEGKISLRMIGEVRVVGLTAQEIARKLEELLTPYYRDPQVEVRVVQQPGRVFYVLGQVSGQGAYRYTGRDTLLHTLARARPTSIAWKSRIKIIRPSPIKSERHEIEINLDRMVKTGDTRMNLLLEPGDVVYVPPTPLGWVGLRLQELVYPIGPVIRAGVAPAAVGDIPDYYNGTGTTSISGF